MSISKLKDFIDIRRITQKEIAVKIGISPNALSQALMKGDMKVSMLEKIAKVLHVSPCIFFDEKNTSYKISDTVNAVNENTASYGKEYNVPALLEKIKGLENDVKNKTEIIELLRSK